MTKYYEQVFSFLNVLVLHNLSFHSTFQSEYRHVMLEILNRDMVRVTIDND